MSKKEEREFFIMNNNKKIITILCLVMFAFAAPVYAWDGYDWENSSFVEIEKGNLVREGNDIEIYDYSRGEYKTYEVEDINNGEIEVYDWLTGERRTFDMD